MYVLLLTLMLGIAPIRQKGTHCPLSVSAAADAGTQESRREAFSPCSIQTEIVRESPKLLRSSAWGGKGDGVQELRRHRRREAGRLRCRRRRVRTP